MGNVLPSLAGCLYSFGLTAVPSPKNSTIGRNLMTSLNCDDTSQERTYNIPWYERNSATELLADTHY